MTSYTSKELTSEARQALKHVEERESVRYISPAGRTTRSRILYAGFTLQLDETSYYLQARGKWNDTGATVTANVAI